MRKFFNKGEATKLTPHQVYLRGIKRKKSAVLCFQIGILALFLLGWEFGVRFGLLSAFLVSSPSRIVDTLIAFGRADLVEHIAITLLECVLGFGISTVLGTLIGILLWWFESLRKIFEPYIVVLNSLPKVALGHLIIIWAGVGMQTIVIMSVLISIIITIMSMQAAFVACSGDKITLMRAMGANKFQIFSKLVFPSALPDLISVLKINVGLSWVGTVMGEFMSSQKGLGNQINYGASKFNHDLVMACTLLLCVLAAAMYFAVALIEKKFKKSRGL